MIGIVEVPLLVPDGVAFAEHCNKEIPGRAFQERKYEFLLLSRASNHVIEERAVLLARTICVSAMNLIIRCAVALFVSVPAFEGWMKSKLGLDFLGELSR